MSTSKGELLVNGYIRIIQKNLTNETIVPIDIISLCLLFWSKPLKFIMIKDDDHQTFNIFYADNKQQASMRALTDMIIYSNTICYIENISKQLNTSKMEKTKHYDGILFIASNNDFHSFPVMCCIFESNAINNCNNNNAKIQCDTIKISEKCPSIFNKLVYCGNKYGVIQEVDGILTRLSLHEFGKTNDDYKFDKIEVNKDDQIWDSTYNWRTRSYLAMEYLPQSGEIFAVHNRYNCFDSVLKQADGPEFIEECRQCGIFDFETKKWRKIASITTQIAYDKSGRRNCYELCMNEYDDNVLYAVSNTGNAQKYDFTKDAWEEIVKSGDFELTYHTVWMYNSNTICCGDGSYFGLLDLSENNPKWNKNQDIPRMDVSGIAVV